LGRSHDFSLAMFGARRHGAALVVPSLLGSVCADAGFTVHGFSISLPHPPAPSPS
jgi:hypothetical protein